MYCRLYFRRLYPTLQLPLQPPFLFHNFSNFLQLLQIKTNISLMLHFIKNLQEPLKFWKQNAGKMKSVRVNLNILSSYSRDRSASHALGKLVLETFEKYFIEMGIGNFHGKIFNNHAIEYRCYNIYCFEIGEKIIYGYTCCNCIQGYCSPIFKKIPIQS